MIALGFLLASACLGLTVAATAKTLRGAVAVLAASWVVTILFALVMK